MINNKDSEIRLLKRYQAMAYLGIKAPQTLKALIETEEITEIKIGNEFRIDKKDLDKFIEKSKKNARN